MSEDAVTATGEHWQAVYRAKAPDEVSWFQRDAAVSRRLVDRTLGSVVDVGAGASVLVDELLDSGRHDVAVLDVSAEALEVTRSRLGDRAAEVGFVVGDVLDWDPGRRYDVWHDRAVFHFLTDPDARRRYVRTAARVVAPGGSLVLGTFAADGPTECSGLPTARYDAEDLARLFAGPFVLEHAESEVHRTPLGARQHFTWVVLRRVAGTP